MNELVEKILTDEAARTAESVSQVIIQTAEFFGPWA